MKRHFYILILVYVALISANAQANFDSYAQMTFEQALDQFPEYSLPLDPQSLPKLNDNLPIADFNNLFTKFVIHYPYIILDDGKKAYVDLVGVIEDEIDEYSPGNYDTTKVYPLGRVSLHPDYLSLLICVSDMEYGYIYMYNFDRNGIIRSGINLTIKDNMAPTFDGAIDQYSFIASDKTITTKALGESEMISMTFSVRDNGVFEMLTYESVETSAANEWGTDERLNDLNHFASTGVPRLKN